jgi:amino acid adenylation domain-containing protein
VPLDPAYPAERLAFLLADSRAPVLLCAAGALEALPPYGGRVVLLDLAAEEAAGEAGAGAPDRYDPRQLAYVIYTSGSTGRPKGVEVSHGSLARLIAWQEGAFGVRPGVRTTQVAGLGFDASVLELWPALARGAEVHLIDEEVRNDPQALREYLLGRGIEVSFAPVAVAEPLLALDWPRGAALRVLWTGGDRVHQHPPAGLPFALVNVYGPTEATVVTTTGRVPAGPAGGPPPIGRPLPYAAVHLLDAARRAAPIGVPGELCIGGPGLARGYLGRPDLTAERFVPDPFGSEPGGRLYRTGDLVRWLTSGELDFLGRADAQVKIRGVRIEPGEVEAAVREYPGVRAAVVVAQGDGPGARLVACVLPEPGADLAPEPLRDFLRAKLPQALVPAGFIFLESLPLTRHGKVDRQALARLSPAPRAYAAPATPAEEILAGIWCEVLGVAQAGRNDNFFDLGGHSLLLIELRRRLQERFGREFSMVEMFQFATVAAMAEHLAAGEAAEPPGPAGGPPDRGEALRQARGRLKQRAERQARRADERPRPGARDE